ncbi:MAG: low molecular weight protein-tyrosine-phosphatase [Pseudomonadota bacterium]
MSAVLFVCLGNICRSPTAEGVFRAVLEREGLQQTIHVDSAGTGAWHRGEPPDSRAQAAASTRGYDLSDIRSRQVVDADFVSFDYILAMDTANLEELRALCPDNVDCRLSLLLDFDPGATTDEVPDPFYGGDDGFETVLNLIEGACEGLLARLRVPH